MAAIGSIRLGSLFFTLPTHGLTGQHVVRKRHALQTPPRLVPIARFHGRKPLRAGRSDLDESDCGNPSRSRLAFLSRPRSAPGLRDLDVSVKTPIVRVLAGLRNYARARSSPAPTRCHRMKASQPRSHSGFVPPLRHLRRMPEICRLSAGCASTRRIPPNPKQRSSRIRWRRSDW